LIGDRAKGLRLIDYYERRVIDTDTLADNRMKYLALSYVWVLPTRYNLRNCTSISRHLPKTIEDAIAVTINLGIRYLWIDKFCIPQNDAAEKHRQISVMASVYRSAEATIVVAVGTDPSHGLPGVGIPRKVEQRKMVHRGQQLVCSLGDPSLLIPGSSWLVMYFRNLAYD
jgi:hypothetical protein